MGLIEISPNSYAAPRTRPAGMDPKVPYEPILDKRSGWKDWVTVNAIKAWFGTPVHSWPTKVGEWWRKGEPAPLFGTPGAPLPDAPGAFKVAVVGDMGEGSPAEERNAAQVLKWAPSHVATLGDNVYPTGREVDWAKRFDPQFAALRAQTTWKPALGNHDYYNGDLTPYFNRFSETGNHAYYSWNLGPAQFFVLDTEQRMDGASAQQAWLAAELAKSTADYKVVQMHRPMISSMSGAVGRNIYGSLGPLLAKYGVQLVLAGHEHGYERSKPIKGTTFMVSGGGGAATFQLPKGAKNNENTELIGPRHHHLQLSFDDQRMIVRAVDDRGVNFDTTTVLPNGSGAASGAARGATLGAATRDLAAATA